MKTIEQIAEILRKAASVVLISATFSVNGVTILYADKMPPRQSFRELSKIPTKTGRGLACNR